MTTLLVILVAACVVATVAEAGAHYKHARARFDHDVSRMRDEERTP